MLDNILKSNLTYILAISGGVDSVALLNMLCKVKPQGCQLIIAHIDHGIRGNSNDDANFVKSLAKNYELKFELFKANLSSKASEAQARKARYDFLNKLKDKYKAQAIITAHHQDDYLETVILNFYRGSHRRGLTSLKSESQLLRPLLNLSKAQIIDYAQKQELSWVEDASNYDLSYLRNKIRHTIMPKITDQQRQQLLAICQKLSKANSDLDKFLDNYLTYWSYRRQNQVFPRRWFNHLDQTQACEVVATWLRQHEVPNYSKAQITYIVDKLRTLQSGKMIIVSSWQSIKLTKRSLCLKL